MSERWNDLQWNGETGHYEVYYLTFTEPETGVGFWIRYTMVAPLSSTGDDATCSLWFMAMDRSDPTRNVGHKVSFPISELQSSREPFELCIAGATLNDNGMKGSFERDGTQLTWDLAWTPRLPAYGHVHPLLRAAKIAKTILFLPQPDVDVSGTVQFGDRSFEVTAAKGGQAHLWGSKHAQRWAWAHCNDFVDEGGSAVEDTFIDGVSVFVPRFGRTIGPNTPVVARIGGEDVLSTGPLAVARNPSEFGLTNWRFSAGNSETRLVCSVSTRVEDLVGVTYHDPDGDLAYCYNTEVADMEIDVYRRESKRWNLSRKLRSDGRAHFEYAQRSPIAGAALPVK